MSLFTESLNALCSAQSAYEKLQLATISALDAAVAAGAGDIDCDIDLSPEFIAYEVSEAVLMEATTALLQAAGRFSVICYTQAGKPVTDIELLKTLFSPYFTGNTENVLPSKRNALVASVLAMNFS